jgi:signal transduction histidine kinase
VLSPPEWGTKTNPERLQQYLNLLREQCDQELELVNNLLDLQRLEAERIHVELVPIDVTQWVATVTSPFKERIQERQLHLSVHLSPALPPFQSDIDILISVLRELLTNACKYTPPGETITIRIQPADENLQLIVSNSGVQIPSEELPRIFDKFYRIPRSDRWKQGGTGLGLALIQKQIEYLKGSIRAESDDAGVHIVVSLPLGSIE